MNDRQRLIAGLYLVTLVFIATVIISIFSETQSGQSIFILFAMALTFAFSVVLLVIRDQPGTPSGRWFSTDNPYVSILISLLVNLIWYYIFRLPTP